MPHEAIDVTAISSIVLFFAARTTSALPPVSAFPFCVSRDDSEKEGQRSVVKNGQYRVHASSPPPLHYGSHVGDPIGLRRTIVARTNA